MLLGVLTPTQEQVDHIWHLEMDHLALARALGLSPQSILVQYRVALVQLLPYWNGFLRILTNMYVYPSHCTASRTLATVPNAISAFKASIIPEVNLKHSLSQEALHSEKPHTSIRLESVSRISRSLDRHAGFPLPERLQHRDSGLVCR